ncbi:MAG: DUF3095 domain-containing protein [Acuticoccus sp.]
MDRLAGLKTVSRFEDILDAAAFRSLPADWVIGVADVVDSTGAIGEGRYKAVNIAGAAPISAMMNALDTRRFAFLFGGDGCAFVLPPADAALVRRILAETAAWVRDDLNLTLRVAVVPVREAHAAGHDVRAALFAPSAHVAYAMFDGGGVAWAEAEMKAGRHRIDPLPSGARPDLTGLSCRWLPMQSRHGAMVSIIVRPGDRGMPAFRAAISELLALLQEDDHPVGPDGPTVAPVSPGTRLEALAARGKRPFWRQFVRAFAFHLMSWGVLTAGVRLGGFDPKTYRAVTAQNADARKFGDGLLLTADCAPELAERARAFLEGAAARQIVHFGMVAQDAALMTCIVPSLKDHGHYHFVDGAGGGYSAAAKSMV